MCQELDNLAREFARYRGTRKQVRYPQTLWGRATEMCKQHAPQKVAEVLGVSSHSLSRYLKSEKEASNNSPRFAPIQITQSQPSVQIHVSGPFKLTIDFSRSTEELAKLLCTIQGGVSC